MKFSYYCLRLWVTSEIMVKLRYLMNHASITNICKLDVSVYLHTTTVLPTAAVVVKVYTAFHINTRLSIYGSIDQPDAMATAK